MIDSVLEIKFSGWTATPRLPFILSGNALCLSTPTYSLILGIIGCCLGRVVSSSEVKIGFYYEYEGVANDIETRQRLEFDGKRVKCHAKGTDAYHREFHILPQLIVWIDRIDWEQYFLNPIGTPALGRSQDLLKIGTVRKIGVENVDEAVISGCMLPFNSNLKIGGQLVQLAESYEENGIVGSGRQPTRSGVFMTISYDNKAKIKFSNLYQTKEDNSSSFYLHNFL